MVRARVHPVAIYLLLQAAAVAAWWGMLWCMPSTRGAFLPAPDWPEATLLAFALPDAVVIVGGSAAAAIGLQRHAAWARPMLWLVAGGVGYATLWCLGGSLLAGGGWLGSAAMAASACGSAWALLATQR